jgi:hypothetical protein
MAAAPAGWRAKGGARAYRPGQGNSTMFSRAKFAVILFAVSGLLRYARWRHPQFAARLKPAK